VLVALREEGERVLLARGSVREAGVRGKPGDFLLLGSASKGEGEKSTSPLTWRKEEERK